jgi:F-type H+-transporting ATPase subunit epsilon
MKLEIITPETKIFNGEAKAVTLPGLDGLFQILNNHAPIISSLSKGEVKVEVVGQIDQEKLNNKIRVERNTLFIPIKGGVAELMNNKLIVLAE